MPTYTDTPGGHILDYNQQDGALTASMLDGNDIVNALVQPGPPEEQSNTNDTIDLGTGDDTAYVGGGDDVVHGGADDDEVWGDLYFVAGPQEDPERAGTGSDDLFGEGGNDELIGMGGNDTLDGGADNDDLSGGAGADQIVGGDGIDTLDAGVDTNADQLDGGLGDDS